jgi:hypothetical protein
VICAILPRLQELYNASLGGTTGNVPLTDDEVKTLADQMKWFADPRLIKVLMKDDNPVGYLFAYPISRRWSTRCRGQLCLGWIDCSVRSCAGQNGSTSTARGSLKSIAGCDGALVQRDVQSVAEGGFHHADLVQIGAENDKMQREAAWLGIDFYKAHRLYRRAL